MIHRSEDNTVKETSREEREWWLDVVENMEKYSTEYSWRNTFYLIQDSGEMESNNNNGNNIYRVVEAKRRKIYKKINSY